MNKNETSKKIGKTAIVPGSFDPITNGHLFVIEEALKRYERVYVAVMINADKNYYFSIEERRLIVEAAINDERITVISSDGWLWKLANELKADGIVKGYRNDKDLSYELEMASFNEKRAPNAKTVLIKTNSALSEVSSTVVRNIIKKQGTIEDLVPKSAIPVINSILKAKNQ